MLEEELGHSDHEGHYGIQILALLCPWASFWVSLSLFFPVKCSQSFLSYWASGVTEQDDP